MTKHDLSQYVDLLTVENPYRVPSDGYIFLNNTASQQGALSVSSSVAIGGVGSIGYFSLFVRKDMIITLSGHPADARFHFLN